MHITQTIEILREQKLALPSESCRVPLFKEPTHSKNENLYFLAPAQTKRMQPILVSCEAPFRSNLKKTTGPVRVMTFTNVLWAY